MKLIVTIFIILVLTNYELYAQNEPIIIEAESGDLGSDYQILSDGTVTYITPKTNFINASYPGNLNKVALYNVTFSDSGTYKLYARIRIGSNNADDDSYFYGNDFGTKNPTNENDWIICNNLVTTGYAIITDVVENQGSESASIWKWEAFSDFTGQETPRTFRVELGKLTRTFEIGAREDGFDIDKLAFGRQGIYYTVDNLNKGEAGSTVRPEKVPIGPPLADGLDKFLGCGYGPDSKRDFEGYWNQVTPGNAGKWGWVESTRNNMVWTDLDEAYKVAMDSNFLFKHHVLVWGAQQPDWVSALSPAEQKAELEEWFTAVADRYPGITQVEVVNEPLHQPPDNIHEGGYINALGGSGITGWDWIIEAFRMARSAFTDSTVLMINEYNIMNSTSNTDNYLKIIHLLQDEDTLINAIGFQAHGFSHNTTNETILRNLDTLASTGLPLYVTELDIDGLTDLQQVHGYMNLFPLFWEHPAIKGITLWGYRPGMWRDEQKAYLVDEYGIERPALKWLRAYLKNEFVPNESLTLSTVSGETTLDIYHGTLQMLADIYPDTSTLKELYWTVSDEDIATIDQNGLLTAKSNGTVTVSAASLELNSDVSDQIIISVTGQTVNGILSTKMEEDLIIYPDPSNNGTFTLANLQKVSLITVYDLHGKLILYKEIYNQSSTKIHLNAPAGMYIVQIFNGTHFHRLKIIVE